MTRYGLALLGGLLLALPLPCVAQSTQVQEVPPVGPEVAVCPEPSAELANPPLDLESKEDPASFFRPKFDLRGRIQTDAVFATQSERNKELLGNLQNAVGFRRARLGAQGTVGDQVRWLCEFEFAGGEIGFRDVYIAIQDLPIVGEFRIGHFREPYSQESWTSSNNITFLERSPGNALDPGRNWGVGLFQTALDEHITLAVGAFRSGTNNAGDDIGDGNDMAYTGRITGLPWYDQASDGRWLMQLGGVVSQRYPNNQVFTFNQTPQSNLLQVNSDNPLSPFVPNISIPASQYQLYNLQWALVLNSISLQAEWNAAVVDQIGGGPVFLQGFYVDVSWFPTGEYRTYNRKSGQFGGPKVASPFLCTASDRSRSGGLGAWELAARFAYLDLASPNMPLQANGLKQGDNLAQMTLGVNWYLNDYTRMMFNYIWAVPVDPNLGPSTASGFFFRAQVYW